MTTPDDVHDAGEWIEAIDRGDPVESVLVQLVRSVEAKVDNGSMFGSILLLERDRLRHVAAPRLAPSYNQAIDGVKIGPNVGSCGTAAYCGHAIFVADIATDPLWEGFRDVALQHGLRACWSTPIVGGQGSVLGTFAVYYTEPRTPTECERALIKSAVETAHAVLDRAGRPHRAERMPAS